LTRKSKKTVPVAPPNERRRGGLLGERDCYSGRKPKGDSGSGGIVYSLIRKLPGGEKWSGPVQDEMRVMMRPGKKNVKKKEGEGIAVQSKEGGGGK